MEFLLTALLIVILASNADSYLGFGGGSKESSTTDYDSNLDKFDDLQNACPARPLGGIEWILHVREPDYGWKENTHRAIIALAVSDWRKTTKENERRLMEQQLEVEITKALLRNNSSPIYPNNLALYIHALIATNRNPRDFHGIDLVGHLLDLMVGLTSTPHPFLLLALCNAKVMNKYHLDILEFYYLQPLRDTRQNTEYTALALQAYQCAGTLNHPINETLVTMTQRSLVNLQDPVDGSFGNVYTTALIVQALAPKSSYIQWDKEKAVRYLEKQSFVDVNMVSTYFIQLALNAERVPYIKSLFPDLIMDRVVVKKHKDNFIQYSLRVGSFPNVHHTISINVPPNSNFFEIMKLSAENDAKYNFSYYMDKKGSPSVFSISNIPNDAEENLYWRLCLQRDINHDRHTSTLITVNKSPIELYPKSTEHVIYWYKDIDCEYQS